MISFRQGWEAATQACWSVRTTRSLASDRIQDRDLYQALALTRLVLSEASRSGLGAEVLVLESQPAVQWAAPALRLACRIQTICACRAMTRWTIRSVEEEGAAAAVDTTASGPLARTTRSFRRRACYCN